MRFENSGIEGLKDTISEGISRPMDILGMKRPFKSILENRVLSVECLVLTLVLAMLAITAIKKYKK